MSIHAARNVRVLVQLERTVQYREVQELRQMAGVSRDYVESYFEAHLEV